MSGLKNNKTKIKIKIMKTTEQNKQEVINYLKRTSIHTFIKPKANFKFGEMNKPGHYEYDYNDVTYFKVFNDGEKWFYIEDGKVKNLDIDHYIKYYGSNAKCVISNILFLDKKMKSVRNNKFTISKVEEVLKNIS